MLDFMLHMTASFIVYIFAYAITESHEKSILITLGVGFGKELYDSLTHSSELIDLIGDFVGIVLGFSVFRFYKI